MSNLTGNATNQDKDLRRPSCKGFWASRYRGVVSPNNPVLPKRNNYCSGDFGLSVAFIPAAKSPAMKAYQRAKAMGTSNSATLQSLPLFWVFRHAQAKDVDPPVSFRTQPRSVLQEPLWAARWIPIT